MAALSKSWLSLLLLMVACALFASTMGAQYADLGGAFSPVFFPRIILAGWIVFAVLSLFSDIVSTPRHKHTRWLAVMVVSVALFVYIQLVSVVGFFISSVLFSIVVLAVTGQRKPLDIILFSLLVPGTLVALFNHLLTMPLPVSPFVWWL